MFRRLFDIAFSIFWLVLTAPLLLIIALLIKFDSPGPVLWVSQGVGKDRAVFRFYNFRTMYQGKFTRVGRFTRNYSLDHLPQLFNLLQGNMTIIGPRPELPGRVNMGDPNWQRILTVKPGLVSPAVLGLATRYNTSDQQLRNSLELEYVDARSTNLDIQILVRATRALIISRGNVKARGTPTVTDGIKHE